MKKSIFSLVCLFLTFFLSLRVKAQPMEPGYPAGLFYQLPFENMPEVNLPYFDNELLLASDTCASCSKRYGVEAIAPFDFWEQSQLQVVNEGNENVEIYRVKIKSPTAKALHVIFEHFELGPDALMFIYSPTDTNRILGAYSMHTNKPNFSFISNRIDGKEMIIEVNRRPKVPNEYKGVLKIKRFIYVYQSRIGIIPSLSCEINAICNPQFNEFCNQVRSTVKFIWEDNQHNFKVCSGVLVNNLNNDFRPFILTASHCMETMINEFNTIVFFNFQSNICSPTNLGNDLMMVTGVSLIANEGDPDVQCPDLALMELSSDLPLQYNVFFSGWNRRPPNTWPNHRGICFHHPGGDVKKMSDGIIKDSLIDNCLKVEWAFGTTEPGSSGAPLFISTKEAIAVVSNGPTNTCANIGELQLKLLEKVEELTLYNILLMKEIEELKKKHLELEKSLNR